MALSDPVFFYGTLRHAPLRRIVLAREETAENTRPAALDDYAVFQVAEGPFPTLAAERDQRAEGIVLSDLTEQDLARLNYYEGGFDYALVPVTLTDGTQAQVFMSAPDAFTRTGPWDFDGWAADWAEMSCHAATEVMGCFGTLTPDQIAARFGQIRTRAWSKVLAGQMPARQGTFDGQVEVLSRNLAYSGFFALEEVRLRHTLFSGGTSAALDRSYLIGSDAALVLPYDPKRDRVLMIEQVRVAPLGRGDPELWQFEPIAGRIDPGETPAEAARREAKEEAGLVLERLEEVGKCYASPGSTTDFFHIYVGLADLPDTATGLGGLESEAEDIRSHLIDFDSFLKMAEAQKLVNAPLLLLCYWLAHHRKRLRS